jgi:hypothetical protein
MAQEATKKGEKIPIPYRQIRALFDSETITVYQAYSEKIASAAVDSQRLDASPDFSPSRMTWIKPSFSWMMYRAGYSFKDSRQARILAIKMTHEGFITLLRNAELTHGQKELGSDSHSAKVKVQWDPERTPKLGKLQYRSIQIGIPGMMVKEWVEEWIVEIKDITAEARELKAVLDRNPGITMEELISSGLVPLEREFEAPEDIQRILAMNSGGEE